MIVVPARGLSTCASERCAQMNAEIEMRRDHVMRARGLCMTRGRIDHRRITKYFEQNQQSEHRLLVEEVCRPGNTPDSLTMPFDLSIERATPVDESARSAIALLNGNQRIPHPKEPRLCWSVGLASRGANRTTGLTGGQAEASMSQSLNSGSRLDKYFAVSACQRK